MDCLIFIDRRGGNKQKTQVNTLHMYLTESSKQLHEIRFITLILQETQEC
jgi:hypothetical protein